MRIAFLSNPTVGHTNFLISIALKSLSMKDDVCFYLPGIKNKKIVDIIDNQSLRINEKLEKNKIPYNLLPIAFSQLFRGIRLGHKSGLAEIFYALKIFDSGSKKYVAYLKNCFHLKKPDILIYDYTFFPAIIISELMNIPRVAIYHSGLPFLEYPIPPIGTAHKYGECSFDLFNSYKSLLKKIEERMKCKYELTYKRNFNNVNLLSNPNGTIINIANTAMEAEYPRSIPEDILFYSGPSIDGHINTKPLLKGSDKKIIYISLGTVFNIKPDLFVRIIESIPSNEYTLIIAAGKSSDFLRKKYNDSENIVIKKFVNQIEILSIASIFITHGGKNSINEALKFGVPMIVFPVGGEQEYNANLIEYLNAGKNFSRMKTFFGKKEMHEAINNCLFDEKITASIRNLADKHNIDGAEVAYNKIIEVYRSNFR